MHSLDSSIHFRVQLWASSGLGAQIKLYHLVFYMCNLKPDTIALRSSSATSTHPKFYTMYVYTPQTKSTYLKTKRRSI